MFPLERFDRAKDGARAELITELVIPQKARSAIERGAAILGRWRHLSLCPFLQARFAPDCCRIAS